MRSLARSPTSLIYNCIYANGVMSEQKSDAGCALKLHTCVHNSSLGIWSKQQVNLIRVMSRIAGRMTLRDGTGGIVNF
jgi:hypothetical protein